MANFNMSISLSGGIDDPAAIYSDWLNKIQQEYTRYGNYTYIGSQADVPVDKGDLKASGNVEMTEDGAGAFHVDVSYSGAGANKTYDYPKGAATTLYPDSAMEADNSAWFVELGHLSRAGNPVPAQPFLGPNFDSGVSLLIDALEGLIDQ